MIIIVGLGDNCLQHTLLSRVILFQMIPNSWISSSENLLDKDNLLCTNNDHKLIIIYIKNVLKINLQTKLLRIIKNKNNPIILQN